jgi:hypothetical protein
VIDIRKYKEIILTEDEELFRMPLRQADSSVATGFGVDLFMAKASTSTT